MNLNRHHGPKVALISIGIGRIQRGFERYFGDLFEELQNELDVTLYKGGGDVDARRRVPRGLSAITRLARMLPLGRVGGGSEYREYKNDCLAFGLALLPELLRERFDVIHFIDPPLARVLRVLQRIFRFRGELVFSNACHMPPQYYPASTHIQHVAQVLFDEALAGGVSSSRVTLAPCGVHASRFAVSAVDEAVRRHIRREHGIADGTFVIAVVSAIKRMHKRVDHIIDEVARIDGDLLLWLDGNPEEPALIEEAKQRLGSRCQVTFVPTARVRDIYLAADVMVHGSLEEAFGLAIVEAMSSGLPVITHASPHFRWLTGSSDLCVDMSRSGELATRLKEMMAGPREDRFAAAAEARGTAIKARFDWSAVRKSYLDMYEQIGGAATRATAPAQMAGATERGR